jgi:hypothetical protein
LERAKRSEVCLFHKFEKIEAEQTLFIPKIGKSKARRSLFNIQIRKIKAERTLFIPQIGKTKEKRSLFIPQIRKIEAKIGKIEVKKMNRIEVKRTEEYF